MKEIRVLNVLFDDRFSGPSRRIIDVASELAIHGVRTTLCLPMGNGNAATFATASGMDVERVQFQRIPKPRQITRVIHWLVRLPTDVYRFVQLLRAERPDIVHVNGAFFLAPALAAKVERIPLVWHLNDTVVPRGLARALGSIVQHLANQVIVAAQAVAKHYEIPLASCRVVYAPVDVERFSSSCAPGALSRDGPVRIGMIGNWNPLKGHEFFLRAAAKVHKRIATPIEFVLVGARLATHRDYAMRIEKLIDDLELQNVIRDYGFVESVEDILRQLDVLVLSSVSEACPMVLLEGMATGLPCIATDVGGVRELLSNEHGRRTGIVVPPRDAEALAEGILSVTTNGEWAASMGLQARARARRLYSLQECVKGHLQVYQTTTDSKCP